MTSTALTKYNPVFAAWQKIYQHLANAWRKGVASPQVLSC